MKVIEREVSENTFVKCVFSKLDFEVRLSDLICLWRFACNEIGIKKYQTVPAALISPWPVKKRVKQKSLWDLISQWNDSSEITSICCGSDLCYDVTLFTLLIPGFESFPRSLAFIRDMFQRFHGCSSFGLINFSKWRWRICLIMTITSRREELQTSHIGVLYIIEV